MCIILFSVVATTEIEGLKQANNRNLESRDTKFNYLKVPVYALKHKKADRIHDQIASKAVKIHLLCTFLRKNMLYKNIKVQIADI